MCRPKEIPLFFLFFLIVINLEEPVFTGSYDFNREKDLHWQHCASFFTREFFFVSGNTVTELIFFYVREFFFIYINGKEEIELR
jgi:hypothetical protein